MEKLTYQVSEPQTIIEPSATRLIITEQSGEPDRKDRINVGPSKTRNIASGDRLRVLKTDIDAFLPALEWATGQQLDIPMPPRSDRDGGAIDHPGKCYEWQIAGHFTPALDEDKIHAIIKDHQLLGPYFRTRKDVKNPERLQRFVVEVMFNHLLPANEIMLDVLEKRGNLKAISNMPKLSKVMQRVLELRKVEK